MVYGAPIHVTKCDGEPPEELVEQLHKQFIQATEQLFEKYREKYGYGDDEVLVLKSARSHKKKV